MHEVQCQLRHRHAVYIVQTYCLCMANHLTFDKTIDILHDSTLLTYCHGGIKGDANTYMGSSAMPGCNAVAYDART